MTSYFYPTTISTWRFDANGAYNTPLLTGSNLITNGNFETWSSPTNAGSWTELLAGTSTVNRESSVVQAGVYSCRFDVDASNNVPRITSAMGGTHGRWIRVDYFWNVNSGSATAAFAPSDASLMCANDARTIVPGWTAEFDTGLIVGSNVFGPNFQPISAANKSVYVDSITGFYLDDASVAAICNGQGVNDTVLCKIASLRTGTHVGVMGWVDSISKLNYIIAFHDGVNVRMLKCVAGSLSTLVNVPTAFVTNANLEIRRPSGNNFEVWYDGVKVGLTQTINDASIINNTNAGILSTYTANRISEMRIAGNLVPYFNGIYNNFSSDRGYKVIYRNSAWIAVTEESGLVPFNHTGWTADVNGLIGGTGFLLTNPTLVGRSGSVIAAINNYTSSSEVGIISNADTLTPTNYLRGYYNGTQFKLDKTVAGVTTNLITVVGSFVSGASLEIVRTALATFQLRYNGAQVGTNQTVNDVAIQNGAYTGLHSNNALNKYINLIVNNQNLPFQLS